jgi:RNA polymerase sigma-70 factor (ECF subfamily)
MANESDRLLIQRIRQNRNDTQAWHELDQRYRCRLKHYVQVRLGAHNRDIEDIVQDIFIGLYNSLINYDENRSLETWLFAIADHKLTDYLRRRHRQRLQSLSSLDQEYTSPEQELTDHNQRKPSSLARSAEQRQQEADRLAVALKEYVQKLLRSKDYRRLMALELLFVLGWPNRDVAKHLQVSEQDIANWRHQFKTWLIKQMKAACLSIESFRELEG